MKRIGLFLLLLVTSAAAPLSADTINVVLKSASGIVQGGVVVAPYYLSIQGGPNVPVVCDDYTHDVFIGEQWAATINSFSTLGATRFGSGDFQQYAESAWLITHMATSPSQDGNLNFAIWALFAPTQTMANTKGWTVGAQNSYNAAGTWFSKNCSNVTHSCNGINLANFEIITPNSTGLNSPQEYMVITPTPEPPTIALVGIALLLLACIARRPVGSAIR